MKLRELINMELKFVCQPRIKIIPMKNIYTLYGR